MIHRNLYIKKRGRTHTWRKMQTMKTCTYVPLFVSRTFGMAWPNPLVLFFVSSTFGIAWPKYHSCVRGVSVSYNSLQPHSFHLSRMQKRHVHWMLLFTHNQVRGHRTGSSHSGMEAYPMEKNNNRPRAVHTHIVADVHPPKRKRSSRKSAYVSGPHWYVHIFQDSQLNRLLARVHGMPPGNQIMCKPEEIKLKHD